MATNFRLKGKRFLLTYSQSDLLSDDIYATLSGLGKDVIRCRIGREQHADGGSHQHVAIEFSSAWDRRNAGRFFDIDGIHPNVRPKRTKTEWETAWDYCKKDGDFKDWGLPQEEAGSQTTIRDFAESTENYGEFLDAIEANSWPFHLAKEIWKFVKSDGGAVTITDENAADHIVGTIPSLHLQALRFDPDELRSVILQGPAEIGKTQWGIRNMPRPCLWVTQIEDLKSFRFKYHKSIIFDDVCLQHRPRSEQLFIVCNRQPRTVWARFSNVRLPRGVHKLFTCNAATIYLPVQFGMGDDGIDSRCKLINVT